MSGSEAYRWEESMKKIPVHLPSAEGNPVVGTAALYEDGVILVELNLEGEGNELHKMIVGNAIKGLSIQGEEGLSFSGMSKDALLSDQISVVDFVEEALRKANPDGL